ncbi:hypothetical protein LEN26_015969 [Aphanomyces euteiches]|nr:hypothetical protein LEN26_015969 [Aphanomyces euteiches]KAH9115171.1 hypothetical protein AeMF1_010785 [Aphanomyces euteiches]KAH9195174.1 hypothetical protein AeNC1_002845 [Aphanomyces euteiches]
MDISIYALLPPRSMEEEALELSKKSESDGTEIDVLIVGVVNKLPFGFPKPYPSTSNQMCMRCDGTVSRICRVSLGQHMAIKFNLLEPMINAKAGLFVSLQAADH